MNLLRITIRITLYTLKLKIINTSLAKSYVSMISTYIYVVWYYTQTILYILHWHFGLFHVIFKLLKYKISVEFLISFDRKLQKCEL